MSVRSIVEIRMMLAVVAGTIGNRRMAECQASGAMMVIGREIALT
jgi:hypothetical protein